MNRVFAIAVALMSVSCVGACDLSALSGDRKCAATIDGARFSARGSLNPHSNRFEIDCSESSKRSIVFLLPNPPHIGAYALGGPAATASADYVTWAYSPPASYSTLRDPTARGTLNIDAYDATTDTVSGTFSFSARLASYVNGAPANASVLAGSFHVRGPTAAEGALETSAVKLIDSAARFLPIVK